MSSNKSPHNSSSSSLLFSFLSFKNSFLLFLFSLNDTNKNLLCGGISGCIGKTFIAPLNRITILLQVTDNIKKITKFGSTINLALGIYYDEGIKAFWKGNLTSVIHRFPYSAINFSVYELLRDKICGKGIYLI